MAGGHLGQLLVTTGWTSTLQRFWMTLNWAQKKQSVFSDFHKWNDFVELRQCCRLAVQFCLLSKLFYTVFCCCQTNDDWVGKKKKKMESHWITSGKTERKHLKKLPSSDLYTEYREQITHELLYCHVYFLKNSPASSIFSKAMIAMPFPFAVSLLNENPLSMNAIYLHGACGQDVGKETWELEIYTCYTLHTRNWAHMITL